MAIRKVLLTVVGHVDHGKTSLLDKIRKTAVTAGEAGAITQAIGVSIIPMATIEKICGKLLDAFKGKLTVPGLLAIDTPGHAAFTSLRKRGGSLADIAILVVDINEGFKPQTIESLEILKANKVPFIIAANKIDLIPGWKSTNLPLFQEINSQQQRVIEELDKRNIGFIVGARLNNLPVKLQGQISESILGQDLKTTTVNYLNHRLICQYLSKRAAKDRSNREKQIAKAEGVISSPSQIARRFRFVQTVNGKYAVNKTLIEKAKRLEGIKGYLTNTNLDGSTVIDRYHDLWKIEKAFRLTKTDLEARPVFLRLDETITCHLIIVFAGLAICRYLEIKISMSIQKILKIAQKVLTHKAFNSQTGEKALIETTILDKELKQKLDLLNSLGH